jgi:uncharacterized protein YceK
MRFPALLGGMLLSSWLSGCSTVTTLAEGIREPWSGSHLDVYILSSHDASFPQVAAAALDYPFSLIADAVVLAFLRPGSLEPFEGPDPH